MTVERQRRYHQRSRAGCLTCKSRHIRCDEGRPYWLVEFDRITTSRTQPELIYGVDSSKCLVTGNECQYPTLREVLAPVAANAPPYDRRIVNVRTVCHEQHFQHVS
jgi:hypothetical protein